MTALEIFAVVETVCGLIALIAIERELAKIRTLLKRKDGEQE